MNEKFSEILLRDRTTGKNIVWATAEHGNSEIQLSDIEKIRPRHEKDREHQKIRTKTRAEIFTPPEICKIQNDLLCKPFDKRHTWQDFVRARFLEITCGEAPYLVNRYDAVTGKPIKIDDRCGLLDRKFHRINSEVKILPDWLDFALEAVQSCYGYEFQGDNLFLARRNVFETVKDYFRAKFEREPPENLLFDVANVISWNIWQMDGLKFVTPYTSRHCRIKNWQTRQEFMFLELFGM